MQRNVFKMSLTAWLASDVGTRSTIPATSFWVRYSMKHDLIDSVCFSTSSLSVPQGSASSRQNSLPDCGEKN